MSFSIASTDSESSRGGIPTSSTVLFCTIRILRGQPCRLITCLPQDKNARYAYAWVEHHITPTRPLYVTTDSYENDCTVNAPQSQPPTKHTPLLKHVMPVVHRSRYESMCYTRSLPFAPCTARAHVAPCKTSACFSPPPPRAGQPGAAAEPPIPPELWPSACPGLGARASPGVTPALWSSPPAEPSTCAQGFPFADRRLPGSPPPRAAACGWCCASRAAG